MTVPTDAYRFWIDMALECVRRDHTPSVSMGDQRGPFLTARALGMALAALHDADALATGGTPLLTVPGAPSLTGTAVPLVAAAACDEILRLRYPKQLRYLGPAWSDWLVLHGLATATADENLGRQYAGALHAVGVTDAAIAAMNVYSPTGAPYTHQLPAHEPAQGFAGSAWGTAKELLIHIGSIPLFAYPFGRTPGAAVVHNNEHQADFDAVVAAGIDLRTKGSRTLEQEVIGIFWAYDGPIELGTPPRLYMQVVLAVLEQIQVESPGKLSAADELRIIAAIGIAMSDAGIHAWHYKYSEDHMMWRPVVGIQKAPGNNGVAVPGWLPLGRPETNGAGQWLTPNFPAYPSGHATFGAAAFQLLRLFLVQKGAAKFIANGKDDIDFVFVSDEYNGRNTDPRTMAPRRLITQQFATLWDAIVDNSISRAYLGVHWFFDGISKKSATGDKYGVPGSPDKLGKTGGVWLGAQIANAIAPMIGVSSATITKSKMS